MITVPSEATSQPEKEGNQHQFFFLFGSLLIVYADFEFFR